MAGSRGHGVKESLNGVTRRLARLPLGVMVLVFLLLSIVVGVLWLVLVPPIMDNAGLDSMQWGWLEGLTSVATFAFAVGAGSMVLLQYSESVSSRNLDVYRDIYEKSMSSEQIEARRYIYQSFPDEAEAVIAFVHNDRRALRSYKLVLSLIDYFGFLVEQNWVTADEIVGWMSPFVVKVWVKIGPVVEAECKERLPEEPDYHRAARDLARKCQQWRQGHYKIDQASIRFDKDRV